MSQSLFVCGLLAVFNLFIASSASPRLLALGASGRWIAVCFFIFYVMQIVAPLLDWRWIDLPPSERCRALDFFVRLSYVAIGYMSCLFIYMAATDVVSLGLRLGLGNWGGLWASRLILGGAIVLLLGVGLVGIYRLWPPVIERVDVPLQNLPAAFDGMKIVQITDLHVGTFVKAEAVRYVVQATKDLAPDLIVVTGDLIDGSPAHRMSDLEAMRELDAPMGKYFVTGNHEYYWNAPAWEAAVQQLGLHVLVNQHVVFTRGKDQLVLAGVPDITSLQADSGPKTDPAAALAGAPEAAVKILLAHQPVVWRAAARAGYDLQISGHTHGGQYFPFTYIIRYFQPLLAGLYREEKTGGKDLWVYVSRGTGFWGPPLRTARPEITLLTLRKS